MVLLLPIALLCRLEINGVCVFRPLTACYVCVSLIDKLGIGVFLILTGQGANISSQSGPSCTKSG